MEQIETAGDVAGPASAGGGEFGSQGASAGLSKMIDRDVECERHMLIEEVEREYLQLPIGAGLEEDSGGAIERGLDNQAAGAIRDAAHYVELGWRAAEAHRTGEIESGGEFVPDTGEQARGGLKAGEVHG